MQRNYDSDFCGSLPLNFINQVQPYGYLIVLRRDDYEIVQVSRNISDILQKEAEDVLGLPFSNLITHSQFTKLEDISAQNIDNKLPLSFSFSAQPATRYLGVVHLQADMVLIELEAIPEKESTSAFLDVYQELKRAMAAIDKSATVDEACKATVAELKKISGFDKVMLYHFDGEWNGTVVAEAMEDGMAAYLGLRFPASDVPKQARELYYKNPYRQIPDREFTPVRLVPVINPVTDTFTDLSTCNLRSVAGVHIEYLRNMDVMSSMSIRIVKDNKLWGLIACHHRSPKFLNYETCSIFELLSGVISQRISVLEKESELNAINELKSIETKLIEQLYTSNDMVDALMNSENTIGDLLRSDNVVVTYGNDVAVKGDVPSISQIKNIVYWLQAMNIKKVFHEIKLSEVYEAGSQLTDVASGMIVLPVNPEKGDYIIGFRPEIVQIVNWGGNPNEAIHFEKDKINYHPRNSFDLWRETVRHTSLPWTKEEIEVAESFRNVLIEFSLKKLSALS